MDKPIVYLEYDKDGYYVKPIHDFECNFIQPPNTTTVKFPKGKVFYGKPTWNGIEWIDSKTKEQWEKEEEEYFAKQPKTLEQRISELEGRLLAVERAHQKEV